MAIFHEKDRLEGEYALVLIGTPLGVVVADPDPRVFGD